MATAVERSQWDHTSLLWATLANANRDETKQRRPFMPEDIHPFRQPSQFTRGQDRTAVIERIRAKQEKARSGERGARL